MPSKYIDMAARWLLAKASPTVVFAEYYKRTPDRGVDYKRQALNLSAKQIEDFQRAVMAATDPTDPRLGDWMRFVNSMHLDGHLMSCVDNRILPVQCAPRKMVDAAGNEDKTATELLDRPWYLEAVDKVCRATFEGVKLIGVFDTDSRGELRAIEEVPPSNFIPQKGIILKDEWDTVGVSYRDGRMSNYYFQVGGDWSLGIFSQLAVVVLAKKLGLGSWMSFIDKFGVPPIFAVTDRMDSGRRDELFEMLANFRMNHFAVLQGNEKIEMPGGYNVDAHNTFKSLMTDVCDREISKRLLGSAGLTDEKAYVGAAEVQERILGYRHKVDKLMWKFYFNTELKPRLVKLSPVYARFADLTFEFDETETLTMKETLAAVAQLAQYFEFDVKELSKITGLPITAIRSAITASQGAGTGRETDDEEEEPAAAAGSKKKFRSLDFLPAAAVDWSDVRLIYAADWRTAQQQMAERVRRGEYQGQDIDREFILKTYDRLNKSAELGYGTQYYGDPLGRRMRENLLRFATVKTYIQQRELGDISRESRNDDDYRTEAGKYLDVQNGRYLDVQAAWASRSAQSARQYVEFLRERDIYPRLRFRTMRDDRVRPTHAVLEGLVLAVDDPRLDEYMPPLDPGCRCWLEQTTAPASDTMPDYHPDPQWTGNAGRTGQIFNDDNSYQTKVTSREEEIGVRRQAELVKEYMPYRQEIKAGKHKVYVSDFADPKDVEQNIEAAKKIARRLEKDVYVRFHRDSGILPGVKNPELSISRKSVFGDLKTYEGKSKFMNFVKSGIKHVSSQGGKVAVLDVSKQPELDTLPGYLRDSLRDPKCNHNVERVIIIRGDKVAEITRKQIGAGDFSALDKLE